MKTKNHSQDCYGVQREDKIGLQYSCDTLPDTYSQQPEVITCQGGREMFKSLCANNDSCLELVSQTQNLPADIYSHKKPII